MLSSDDTLLVSREPDLPALATLLDEMTLLAVVRRCPGMDRVTAARCTYLRYKPRTSCLARLVVTTDQGEQFLTAKAYRVDAGDKLQKLPHSSGNDGTSPWQTLVRHDLALVFHRFPYDDKLPNLAAAHQPQSRQDLLERLLATAVETETQAGLRKVVGQDCQLKTLRYKPQRRYVARLDCQGNPRAVLKMYNAADYGLARRAIKTFSNLSGIRTARPLGHSDRYQTLLLEWLRGPSLDELLSASQVDESLSYRVGQSLAGLHRQKTVKLPLRTGESEIESLRAAARGLRWLACELASRVDRLVLRISRQLGGSSRPKVTLHGDFDPSQVLVLDGTSANPIGLIDLDHAALGNPAWDLANFLAHLQRKVCFGQLSEAACNSLGTAFLSGYQEAGQPIDQRELEIWAAARLVQLAHEPFRYRSQNWRGQIGALVDRAGRLLGEPRARTAASVANRATDRKMKREVAGRVATDGAGQGRVRVEVVDSYAIADDQDMPFLRQAIVPRLAEPALVEALAATHDTRGLQLRAIRVVRYKPRRRCMIEYTLAQAHRQVVVLGKAHAKGKHMASHDRQQALWKAGFHDRSPDGITVARPLGLIPQWHLWLQEKLPGQTAWHALQTARGPSVAKRIASAAYKLHSAHLPTRRRHTIATELEILTDRLPRVAHALPQFERRISVLLEACEDLADELPIATPVGIHRDFYPDQVLVDGTRIHVLDHDLVCLGDAELDLGNFCGHLIEYSLRTQDRPDRFAECQEAMIEQYVRLAGRHVREPIAIYTTLTLARHIYLSTQFQERKQTTSALLALCEQRLASWMADC